MHITSRVLLIATAAVFWIFRARSDSPVPWDAAATALFVGVLVGWLVLSQIIIGFIDARNRSQKIVGLAGFFALLVAIFGVAAASLRLKSAFDPSLEFPVSFQADSPWLVIFPFLFYQATRAKRMAAQAPAPTPQLGRGSS